MVKGCNDKQSGFWMFLSQVVQPQILRCEGRRIGGEELKIKGSPMWTALSDEERQRWKDKAKAFNNSTAGRADQKKKREWFRERKSRLAQPLNASQQGHQSRMKQSLIMPPSGRVDEIDQQARVYFDPDSSDFIWKREHDVNELVGQYTWRFGQQSTGSKLERNLVAGKEVELRGGAPALCSRVYSHITSSSPMRWPATGVHLNRVMHREYPPSSCSLNPSCSLLFGCPLPAKVLL
ncbi:unnamed protein product [Toxocara canis]|uniref:HMG box domain-containing protein n=1 Tax=Toxocara canis TaxID=6265 RepID=A0A183UWN3_TOXCA|nr:unnamed protein product [Toxocara canis]